MAWLTGSLCSGAQRKGALARHSMLASDPRLGGRVDRRHAQTDVNPTTTATARDNGVESFEGGGGGFKRYGEESEFIQRYNFDVPSLCFIVCR